jgi:hypothetical protein
VRSVKLAAIIAALAAASCGPGSGPGTAGPSAPVISRATIIPESPLANSNVSVQVEIANPTEEALSYRTEWFVDGRSSGPAEGLDLLTQGLAPGTRLRARVIASDGTRDSKPFDTPEAVIAENLSGIDSVAIVPSPVRTGTASVTVQPFFAPGASSSTKLAYRWSVNGTDQAETGPTLALSGRKSGDRITVEATPQLGVQKGNPFRVNAIVVNDAPVVTAISLASQDASSFTYRISASDPDNDPLAYQLVSGPAGVSVDGATGLITVPAAAAGQGIRVRISDNAGNWIERDISAGK